MKAFARFVAVLFLAFVVLPTPSSAQDRPQTRDGFFIGFGFGWGSLGVSDTDERESGVSGFLKLGGTLNDQVLLGAESNAWLKEESGVTLTVANVTGIVQFYPSPTSGFFLKGGLGFNRLEVESGGLSASDDGLGVIGGLGLDVRLGANFSLTPYANYVYGSHEGGSTNVMQLGLGVMWH